MSTASLSPARPALVLGDLMTRSRVGSAVAIGVGALAVAAAAQVSVPLWPVPITGQTLAVIVVGAVLGPWRGAASLTLYMLVGLAGAPVFANFTGGPASVLKPSFGFVIGFIFAAMAMGFFARRTWDRHFWRALGAFMLVSAIPFLFGLPYLAMILGTLGVPNDVATVLAAGFTPFIVGGFIKAALAAAILAITWRIVGRPDSASPKLS